MCIRIVILVFLLGLRAKAQAPEPDWQSSVRQDVRLGQLDAALARVERRISESPTDLEARGWRARVLSWQGRWADGEREYRYVLERAPEDTDILSGLADVLAWQGKTGAALAVIERACSLAPGQTEVLRRRARLLVQLGDTAAARRQYREILALDSHDQQARAELGRLSGESKHELRAGTDIDTFNYTDAAGAQSFILNSRWTDRWSSSLGASFYERFSEKAAKLEAAGTFRFTRHDWLTASFSVGHDNGIIPKQETQFAYGHGIRIANKFLKGLEATYQQHWLWYQGAHVLTLGVTQSYYLPREWLWSLTLTGARSGFTGTAVEWRPSGVTRLAFPLHEGLTASLGFAVGTENYAQVDQIGRFSARTYLGGLKYRLTARQDIAGYIAAQDRSQGRAQNSYGLNYGFRF